MPSFVTRRRWTMQMRSKLRMMTLKKKVAVAVVPLVDQFIAPCWSTKMNSR